MKNHEERFIESARQIDQNKCTELQRRLIAEGLGNSARLAAGGYISMTDYLRHAEREINSGRRVNPLLAPEAPESPGYTRDEARVVKFREAAGKLSAETDSPELKRLYDIAVVDAPRLTASGWTDPAAYVRAMRRDGHPVSN